MAITKLTGTLVYVMLDEARPCYEKDKGHEWKAGVVLTDEDEVDAFIEEYPKQSVTKVKASQFEEIYKTALPEGAGKNVWVITLRKNTKLSNGNEVPEKYRPRVFHEVGNKLVDITMSKLPGNGSKGVISIDRWEGEKGNIARLKNVKVTELIEYERPEGTSDYEPGDEFSDTPKEKAEEKPKAEKKPAAKKAKVEPKVEQEDNDDPF